MQKFSSIEQFKGLITNYRKAHVSYGIPLEKEVFEGTVKLHGTNAGVRIHSDRLVPQSRERVVSIGSDNAGFAQYVMGHEEAFKRLNDYIKCHCEIPGEFPYTIFGEWCGGNIQSKVGLNSLDKHFVVFNVWDHSQERYEHRDWMNAIVDDQKLLEYFHEHGIYFVYEIPRFEITIDFAAPEQSIETLERLTLQVEEKCPWAAYRGAEGIGEGIVWALKRNTGDSRYWFKTKGVKHQGKDQSKVKTISADPVKVSKIRDLVALLLPEWRLEQGVAWLRENNYGVEQRATGQYLQWINTDILKEESDTIAANPFDWKELSPYINQTAREWYFRFLVKDACTKDAA